MRDQAIGIIGCGVVGEAVADAFFTARFPVTVYDKYKKIGTMIGVVSLADIIFVCVPTPTDDFGKQDRSALIDVLTRLDTMKFTGPVVVKCTVTPGTMDEMAKTFPKLNLVHNPEFLTEANAKKDFLEQKVCLLSGKGPAVHMVVHAFKHSLPKAEIHVYPDFKITELAKYIHNCFLATKVAFMNQMFDLAGDLNTDYLSCVEAARSQGKIGDSHLKVPGPDGKRGFGGMCFPKDTQALVDVANGRCSIIQAAIDYNKKIRG